MQSSMRSRRMIAPTLWTVSVLMGTPALAEYTHVKGSPASEAGHREILSGIYGGDFTGSGTDLGNGLFTLFTNGTITAERVDDFGLGTVLNLATSEPGSGDDGLWTDGIAVAAAEARYALFPQEFGFDVGLGYTKLFELAGSGFLVAGSGMVNFSLGTTWAWARANDSDSTLVNVQYSLDSMNGDNLDHMLTYRITGIPNVPPKQKVWLLFWEDLNGAQGNDTDPDNRGFRADRDFNDMVVEVRAFECIEDFDCDPEEVCDTERGLCKQCLATEDCSGGLVCDPTEGVCRECREDAECVIPGEELCNTEHGICRQCLASEDCFGGLVCDAVEGACRECLDDAECDDADPRTVDTCEAGRCLHVPVGGCGPPLLAITDTDLTLVAASVDLRQESEGPVTTKARFTVWNENETRFSGTTRCVTCSDSSLLSHYGFPNHFLIHNLQTDKGKTRIEGLASNMCDGSSAAPLLGVAVKEIRCDLGQVAMRTALTPVATGTESAQIRYDPLELPSELTRDFAGFTFQPPDSTKRVPVGAERLPSNSMMAGDGEQPVELTRGSVSKKGSLLFWPKVEIKWDVNGRVIQDTFIELTNDFPGYVFVHLFFVNGDGPIDPVLVGNPPITIERGHPGWNNTNMQIVLTANEPTFWSALTGGPKGVSPFTVLDWGDPPGRPDLDSDNPGDRVLRGFIVGWAVNLEGHEIRWNHLAGAAMIVNYPDATASQHGAWAFQCVDGSLPGEECGSTPGLLNMDGREFDACPANLLLDFYASGSTALSNSDSLGP